MRIFLIFFFVIFCLYTQVSAQIAENITTQNIDSVLQNTEIIEMANPFPTLKNHIYYTKTTKNNNNLENIAQLPFKKLNFELGNDYVNIKSDSIYWVKTQVYSKLDYDKEVLLFIGGVARAEVYVEYADKKIVKLITGESYSNDMRDIKQAYGNIRLFLPKNQVVKIWVLYETQNKLSRIILKLSDKEKITEIWLNKGFSSALLQGAFWIMMLYNFLLFFVFRDKAYLYYVCYIFVSSIFIALQNIPYEFWILDKLIAYKNIMAYLCISNVAIFYILFVKYFVRQDEDYPTLAKHSIIYVAMRTIINVIFVVLMLQNMVTDIFGTTTNIILVCDIIFGIYSVSIIAKGKKNMLLNRFLLAGSLCLFGGGAIDTFSDIFGFNIPFSFFTYGFLGEIIIFTFGLAQRSSMIEKEKRQAQEELILQLEANDELQRNINRDLEQKVAERTLEVVHQNEELEANSQLLIQQNDRLDKAYTHITDSVRYAKRIQTALLPSKTTWEAVLPNSFVLYKPKDIVSGDFYWFAKERENIFIAVADCTGHGVPGAFMTVIGNNILNQIISENSNINNENSQNCIEPAYLLTELDKRLLQTLQQQGVEASKDKVNDGMDIALAKINVSTAQITVSSAKRVVYQFRNNELIEHEPNKFPIGSSHFGGKVFEQKVINYQQNDIFYLFTDGYPDQFGGTENRKFMIKQFRNLLIEIHNLPLSEQHEILNTKIENWKNGTTQTDDILVMGLKM